MQVLKSLASRVWAGAVLLLVLAGALVLALRLLLPLAAEYRDQLARELSAAVGAPVRIERLGARLAGLSPELRMSGVEILDPGGGEVRLRFREVRLRLDPLASLLRGVPEVELATIVGAHVLLRRQADGRLRLLGREPPPDAEAAATSDPSPETGFSPAPFFDEGRLRLEDSEILWENRLLGLPPLHLVAVEAKLVNAGIRHQLDLRAQLAGGGQGGLELKADFFGAPASPVDWRGDIYLKTRGLPLEPVLGPLLAPGAVLGGDADIELWSRWSRGRPASVVGSVRLVQPHLSAGGGEWFALERLGCRFDWRAGSPGWWLGVRDLELEGAVRRWSGGALGIRVLPRADGGRRVLGGAEGLPLDALAAMARSLPLTGRQRQLLAGLEPGGRVASLRLVLEAGAQGRPRWEATGRLEDLAWRASEGIPGVQGLDLDFAATPDHGRLTLDGRDLELRFPGLFRWPMTAERLAGDLDWRLDDDATLELESGELVLGNRDLRTRSRLRLRIPGDGSGPRIDMQTDFHDGVAAGAGTYLPVGIMPPALVKWLDRALVGGRVPSGSFVLRGPLRDFPFRNREGRFQVLFGAEQAILDYQQGWPRLEETTAEVLFLNEGLEIRIVDAGLLESRVDATRVWIPDLGDASVLHVAGQVRGPFADGLRILRETPLARQQALYVRGMRASGTSEVDLDLAVPLRHGQSFAVDGRLHWTDRSAALELGDWGLTLARLRGTLGFTERGVFADGIRARLWDTPLRLDLETTPARGRRSASTRIGVDLRLNAARLAQRFPHWLWDSLQGEAPGRLLLDIRHIDAGRSELPLDYRLESDLRGIQVDLPAPLNKASDERRPLFVSGSLPLAAHTRIQAGYGDIGGTFLVSPTPDNGPMLESGAVRCGNPEPPPAQASGFHLEGHLDRVDLAAWSDWFAVYGDFLGPADEETVQPEQQVALDIDELTLIEGHLTGVHLGMVRTPHAWEAEIASDQLKGGIRFPDQPRKAPVSAHLESLRLDLDQWGTYKPGERGRPDPRRAPGLYLDVEKLFINGHPFGSLSLKATPVEDGLKLEQLRLAAPLMTLEGEGDWRGDAAWQRTRLALQARSPDLGKALRELQFSSALGEAEASVTADLAWSAPPLQANLENLEGVLDLHIGKGRVLEVEPGLGRFFGLFNLGALGRRLSLDFTDLFKKGYAFDGIDGLFTLGEGEALIDEMVIEGPAARVEVEGRTDLLERSYDQLVTVTPEISATLPLAGAIAGGPVVAAALLVAEQIMGKEVDKLIRYQYRVTGPWEEPAFARVETRDGWSLSNLLQPEAEKKAEEVRPPPEGGFVH